MTSKNKVFTKVFNGVIAVSGAQDVDEPARDALLVQEDIDIIGASLTLASVVPSENDGFASCYVELSQTGITKQDGLVLGGHAMEGWNTTPAGIMVDNCNVTLVLPAGKTIPVKEEGHLYINVYRTGKSAGVSVFSYVLTVFYTK